MNSYIRKTLPTMMKQTNLRFVLQTKIMDYVIIYLLIELENISKVPNINELTTSN